MMAQPSLIVTKKASELTEAFYMRDGRDLNSQRPA